MRIKKVAQSLLKGLILNTKSDSTSDTYSCNHINDLTNNSFKFQSLYGDTTDINEIVDSGIYSIYASENTPDGGTGWYNVIKLNYNNDMRYCFELVTVISSNVTYIRNGQWSNALNDINWSGWQPIMPNASRYADGEIKVGTWINNKPLYRKVINFGTLPNATEKQVAHGIGNLDTIVNIRGMAKNPSTNSQFMIPHSSTQNNAAIYVYGGSTYVTIGTGLNRAEFTQCYVILEYTKTTD